VRGILAGLITGNDETVLADYVPMLFRLFMNLLSEGRVDECVEAMSVYNVTPAFFKDHLVSL
jgi:hypothetical protein